MTTDTALPSRPLGLSSRDSYESTSSTSAKSGANPLSSKVASVLSTSYADSEFREALTLLDERGVHNTAETRRKLRLDLQREVIDSNGEIISEFAKVAEVCILYVCPYSPHGIL